jgi:serine protease Do
MKVKLIPVIVTAALTSLLTLFVAGRFNHQSIPYFSTSSSAVPVNYARYDNNAVGVGGPVNFENAAEGSVKAVVHIKTTTKARMVSGPNMDDLFGQLFGQRQYYVPSQMGSGSGVVISPDGYIVTNNHVVADANEVTVTFNDRYTKTAKVIGTDPATDIAVLKVDGESNLPFMEFGNSDNVKLGQWVLAVGYPLSLDATVTAGIVSAKGRSIGVNRQQSATAIESFIQTDAAVNPGNSGGALVNTNGQLIGINSAIASPTGSYAGYSYAIPANIVKKAVDDILKYGSVQRAYLGISPLDLRNASPDQLKQFSQYDLDHSVGVLVQSVLANGGADKAGIKVGDFITQINGEAVNSVPELLEQIARYHPGDNISLTYARDGQSHNTTVQLTNSNKTTDIIKDNDLKMLGATFRNLNDGEKHRFNVDGGVVVTKAGTGTLGKQANIGDGFVITSINDEHITSLNDLQKALASSSDAQIGGFYPGRPGMYYYGLRNVNAMADEQ